MNWQQINKGERVQPAAGSYGDWKEQIAEDCNRRCVYCSIGEQPWGGIDHYHIDHFRPKSIFEALVDIITNLYYACPVCNRFKSDDWPSDLIDLDQICYPDPSDYDYSTLFDVDNYTFSLLGKNKAAKYVLERLYLNRPQLIYERREFFLKLRADAQLTEAVMLLESADKFLENKNDGKLIIDLGKLLGSIAQHVHQRDKIRPYTLSEIQKPKSQEKKAKKKAISKVARKKKKPTPKKIEPRKNISKKKANPANKLPSKKEDERKPRKRK